MQRSDRKYLGLILELTPELCQRFQNEFESENSERVQAVKGLPIDNPQMFLFGLHADELDVLWDKFESGEYEGKTEKLLGKLERGELKVTKVTSAKDLFRLAEERREHKRQEELDELFNPPEDDSQPDVGSP